MNAMTPITARTGSFMDEYGKLEGHLHTLAGLSSLLACLLAEGDNSMSSEREHCALADAIEKYAADAQDLAETVCTARRSETVAVETCPQAAGGGTK